MLISFGRVEKLDNMPVDRDEIIAELKKVLDPEIRLDVWTLGLIYDIIVEANDLVRIRMTLTSPGCPYGPAMMASIEQGAKQAGATEVKFDVVFDPPWQPPEDLKWSFGAFGKWGA
jgi:metal-sulfur cluster biosynthetic enzyme